MRSFALAAILLTIGVGALVLIGVNALAVPAYSEAALREFDIVYRVLGWGKYAAALLLLYLGNRAVARREYIGWHRAVLLWAPLLLFFVYAWMQWGVLGDAYLHYLKAHGRSTGFSGALFYMIGVFPLAFAVAAINWGRVRRRELRLTTR
jgi:hypothetical protein